MPPRIPAGKAIGASIVEWKKLDKIYSGALLQFGDMKIGEFTNKSLFWARGTGNVGRSIAYFAGGGAGRLSAGMAQSVREWVVAALTDENARSNNAPGYVDTPRSEFYGGWVEQIQGQSIKGSTIDDPPTGHLTGRRAGAFGVIKQSGGGLTLGIREGVITRTLRVGALPLQLAKATIEVAKYSQIVEFGKGGFTNAEGTVVGAIPPRPIISKAIVGWLSDIAPEWGKGFDLLIKQILAESDKATYGDEDAMNPKRAGSRDDIALQAPAFAGGSESVGARGAIKELEYAARSFSDAIDLLNSVSKGIASGKVDLSTMGRGYQERIKETVLKIANEVSKDEATANRIWLAVMAGKPVDTDRYQPK